MANLIAVNNLMNIASDCFFQNGGLLHTGHRFSFVNQVSMQEASYSWPHLRALTRLPDVKFSMQIRQESAVVLPLYHMDA